VVLTASLVSSKRVAAPAFLRCTKFYRSD